MKRIQYEKTKSSIQDNPSRHKNVLVIIGGGWVTVGEVHIQPH